MDTVHADARYQRIFLLFPRFSCSVCCHQKHRLSGRIHLHPRNSRQMVDNLQGSRFRSEAPLRAFTILVRILFFLQEEIRPFDVKISYILICTQASINLGRTCLINEQLSRPINICIYVNIKSTIYIVNFKKF